MIENYEHLPPKPAGGLIKLNPVLEDVPAFLSGDDATVRRFREAETRELTDHAPALHELICSVAGMARQPERQWFDDGMLAAHYLVRMACGEYRVADRLRPSTHALVVAAINDGPMPPEPTYYEGGWELLLAAAFMPALRQELQLHSDMTRLVDAVPNIDPLRRDLTLAGAGLIALVAGEQVRGRR